MSIRTPRGFTTIAARISNEAKAVATKAAAQDEYIYKAHSIEQALADIFAEFFTLSQQEAGARLEKTIAPLPGTDIMGIWWEVVGSSNHALNQIRVELAPYEQRYNSLNLVIPYETGIYADLLVLGKCIATELDIHVVVYRVGPNGHKEGPSKYFSPQPPTRSRWARFLDLIGL